MIKPTFFQAIRAQAAHMNEIAALEPLLHELYTLHLKLSQRLGFTSEERARHGEIAESLRPYVGLSK